MDASVRLALMAKAQAVFQTETTFLSFPALNPHSHPREWFNAATAGAGTVAQLRAASEFSRVVNGIPRGVLFDDASDESLWQVYLDMLTRGHPAAGSLSPEDAAIHQRAAALLSSPTSDGLRADSPQLRTYKQYRDAFISAEEEYRNAEATQAAANDAAAYQAWVKGKGAELRAAIDALRTEWITQGFKNEIEQAQQEEDALARNAPIMRWNEWRTAFDPSLDVAMDPDGQSFAMTGLVPSNAFDGVTWPTFTLSANEIASLVNKAAPELKAVLGSGDSPSNVVSLAFEYRSVAVTRPWFNPGLFAARFWRLPQGEPPLSDGATPTSGRCPAYVVALVLARNITLTTRQSNGVVQNTRIMAFPALRLRIPPVAPVLSPRPLMARPAALRITPALATALHERLAVRPVAAARLAATDFHAIRLGEPRKPPVPAPAPSPQATTQQPITAPDEISILAFICKRVPRSPDPDPSLNWTT